MKLATVICLLLITSVPTVFAQATVRYENTFCMQRRCPYYGSIRCKFTGYCVGYQYLCNGYDICGDGTDEEYCDYSGPCPHDGDFRCGDGSCIRLWNVCDRYNNCRDGSDEINCGPTYNGCYLRNLCDDGSLCLRNWQLCDGIEHCSDGYDEANCGSRPCPYDGDFRCGDGACIRQRYICNIYNNCRDGSDEFNCSSRPCPLDGNFRCDDGRCVSSAAVCNGYNNCQDGSDETNCDSVKLCPYEGDFQCNSHCHRAYVFCDGGLRCNDVDFNCSSQSCPYDGDFRCSNGGCVRSYDVCNDNCNCWDCSDEENCTSRYCDSNFFYYTWCPEDNTCTDRDYECYHDTCGYNSDPNRCKDCRNSTLLNYSVLECDGINDCEDGNDEMDCYNRTCFAADDFRCTTTGACIRKLQVCDGKQHCSDNSDEENCLFRNCTIPGDVKCRDNGTCIHSDMICNEIIDCMDGSDEENCSSRSCPFHGDRRCYSSQACVRSYQWCNNRIDCYDESDEDNCYKDPCPYNGDFRCTYGGSCIREHQVCDGHQHCLDGSDEGMNYCPEDFTLGLLWERSLTKTTYKHNCSDIHPSFKFADKITRDCLKNRTWAPVNISQCVMNSDSPVIMIVTISLQTDNTSLVKSREEKIIEQVNEMILEHPAVQIDILQYTLNVSLKITYEFNALTVNEVVEAINYEMTFASLANISVSNISKFAIFESTDVCQCPNTINSSTIPIGVRNNESVEILSVCSGKPCDDSCSNYSECKCLDQFAGNGIICGKDSDGDGYPDMMLDCDDPHCVQDSCPTVHNPEQSEVCHVNNSCLLSPCKQGCLVKDSGYICQCNSKHVLAADNITCIKCAQSTNPTWHVALCNTSSDDTICSGTVISDQWVLTSARCVCNNGIGINKENLSIRFGKNRTCSYRDTNELQLAPKKIYCYPDYTSDALSVDIAAIKLESPIPVDVMKQSPPLCIGNTRKGKELFFSGGYVEIFGWGKVGNTVEKEATLQSSGNIVVSAIMVCREAFKKERVNDRSYRGIMCTIANTTSACTGNYGSAVVAKERNTMYFGAIVSKKTSVCGATNSYLAHSKLYTKEANEWVKYTIQS